MNPAERFCTSRSCCSERWWPPGKTSSRLGSRAACVQLLADRVGHLLVSARVQQHQRRGRAERGGGREHVEGARATAFEPVAIHREVGAATPSAGPAASSSSGAGQMATTAAVPGRAAAAWMANRPPMLEPRSATAGACSARAHNGQRVVDRARPERTGRSAVPAGVVGQRGEAALAAEPPEVEVALLGRAGAVQDHHAAHGLALGHEERVGEAVVDCPARAAPGGRAS